MYGGSLSSYFPIDSRSRGPKSPSDATADGLNTTGADPNTLTINKPQSRRTKLRQPQAAAPASAQAAAAQYPHQTPQTGDQTPEAPTPQEPQRTSTHDAHPSKAEADESDPPPAAPGSAHATSAYSHD